MLASVILHLLCCVHLVRGPVFKEVVPKDFRDVLRAIMNDAGLDHMQVRVELILYTQGSYTSWQAWIIL